MQNDVSDDLARPAGATEAYRAEFRRECIPGWYRGQLHVLWTGAWVLVPMGYCISQLQRPSPLELLTVPLMLVFGSFFVWTFHKHVLHRPVPGLREAYKIHTLQHHRFYTFDHNEPHSARDFFITLFPLGFAPGLAFTTLLLGHFALSAISPNVGLLFTTMSVAYFGLYELVHFASHLPASAPVLRLPFLARLRAHHRLHHDPRLMGTKNFNVVLPLFDALFGTLERSRPQTHKGKG
ncbi:MAG TPA: sterol desaturase family protein [Polyangiales bacterium]|nr:sterol desaturase family protein [Polyangiales bacterium]